MAVGRPGAGPTARWNLHGRAGRWTQGYSEQGVPGDGNDPLLCRDQVPIGERRHHILCRAGRPSNLLPQLKVGLRRADSQAIDVRLPAFALRVARDQVVCLLLTVRHTRLTSRSRRRAGGGEGMGEQTSRTPSVKIITVSSAGESARREFTIPQRDA